MAAAASETDVITNRIRTAARVYERDAARSLFKSLALSIWKKLQLSPRPRVVQYGREFAVYFRTSPVIYL